MLENKIKYFDNKLKQNNNAALMAQDAQQAQKPSRDVQAVQDFIKKVGDPAQLAQRIDRLESQKAL